MTTPQMDWLDDQRRQGVLGAGFYGPTEGERRRKYSTTWLPPSQPSWRAMCGDRVVTPDGWTGRVVAQHGPYSWVSMEATNSPQTQATMALRPVENLDEPTVPCTIPSSDGDQ